MQEFLIDTNYYYAFIIIPNLIQPILIMYTTIINITFTS